MRQDPSAAKRFGTTSTSQNFDTKPRFGGLRGFSEGALYRAIRMPHKLLMHHGAEIFVNERLHEAGGDLQARWISTELR